MRHAEREGLDDVFARVQTWRSDARTPWAQLGLRSEIVAGHAHPRGTRSRLEPWRSCEADGSAPAFRVDWPTGHRVTQAILDARPKTHATRRWTQVQRELIALPHWIIAGDLGPYDVPADRVERVDTVLTFDFSPIRCAWRAARRSCERADFWR